MIHKKTFGQKDFFDQNSQKIVNYKTGNQSATFLSRLI